MTEQLEGAAVVLGEGADLEVKCWRPPLSFLEKRFGLKTELYWIVYHLPFSHVTPQKTKAFQLAKALLKGTHSDDGLWVHEGARRGPASAAHWIGCANESISYLLS